jgi:hypothetical protein
MLLLTILMVSLLELKNCSRYCPGIRCGDCAWKTGGRRDLLPTQGLSTNDVNPLKIRNKENQLEMLVFSSW